MLAAGLLPLGMLPNAQITPEVRSRIVDLKVVVLLITLVATTLAILIARYITIPVEAIIKEMEELNARQDPGDSVEPRTSDEIDRLAKLYQRTFVPMKGYLTTADLFLQMTEGILSLNADGKIAFLNTPAERLFGVDRQRYAGRHYEELLPDRTRNFEIYELIDEVLKTGSPRTRDVLLSTAGGRDVYVRVTASPATGRRKESIGVVMLFQDIEELTRLRDQLRRMDVLASIGGTIAGMAHEVKTPLGYIRGLAELIKEDLPNDAPQMKYIDSIVESIDRLNQMVEEILSLASVKIDNSTAHDPKTIVREAIMYVREMLTGNSLQLVEDYPHTTSPIKADRQKLVECFINILRNACEAAPRGSSLDVRIRPVILGHAPDIDQDTVMFEFHNEGSYIPPETKEKLFTPFFTTKKKGTGLGLAISKQIVEAHGGAIQVESEPHSGTLFRVLLPAGLGRAASAASESASTK
jgi:PAS domain S-box-containing protein